MSPYCGGPCGDPKTSASSVYFGSGKNQQITQVAATTSTAAVGAGVAQRPPAVLQPQRTELSCATFLSGIRGLVAG